MSPVGGAIGAGVVVGALMMGAPSVAVKSEAARRTAASSVTGDAVDRGETLRLRGHGMSVDAASGIDRERLLLLLLLLAGEKAKSSSIALDR